jgi:hypothetical protein
MEARKCQRRASQLVPLATGLVGDNAQVTIHAIGAPAQVMLKVPARHLRALLQNVEGQGLSRCDIALQTRKARFSPLELRRHRVALTGK